MPFSIRPFRRFPVQCAVTYNAGPFQGEGMVWNLSCTGWRLSGDLPMRQGEPLSLTVTLPTFSASCSTFRTVRSRVSNVATVMVYVFPYRSPLLNWIRNFLRHLSSTPASSQSLNSLEFGRGGGLRCNWSNSPPGTTLAHRPYYLPRTARVSSGGVSGGLQFLGTKEVVS